MTNGTLYTRAKRIGRGEEKDQIKKTKEKNAWKEPDHCTGNSWGRRYAGGKKPEEESVNNGEVKGEQDEFSAEGEKKSRRKNQEGGGTTKNRGTGGDFTWRNQNTKCSCLEKQAIYTSSRNGLKAVVQLGGGRLLPRND